MDEIDTLIRELEEATEGSRKLDEKIHKAIGDPGADDPRLFAFEHGDYPPHYTTSIDAALTLVPEGCRWDIQQDKTAAFASIDGETTGRCATPALALCIAALQDRSLF